MDISEKYDELRQFILLHDFTDEELNKLAPALEECSVAAGEYLYHPGDAATEVYLIRSGYIETLHKTKKGNTEYLVNTVVAGNTLGELALLDGTARSIAARAKQDSQLFLIHLKKVPVSLLLLSRLVSNIALSGSLKLRDLNQPNKIEDDIDVQMLYELKQFILLQGFSDYELKLLSGALEARKYKTGEYLFYEHEQSSQVYLIRSGQIDVCKTAHNGSEQVIAHLHQGQEVGEFTLLEGAPRSASACVSQDSSVFVLDLSQLSCNLMLLGRLTRNVTLTSLDKLRSTNEEHVQSLERELESTQLRNQFGMFFIYASSIFAIATLVNHLLHTHLDGLNVYGDLFQWVYLLVLLIPSFFTVWHLKIPLKDLGLTLKGWEQSVTEGIAASLIALGIFIVFLDLMRHFELMSFDARELSIFKLFTYLLHSFFQELIGRGIAQSSFQRFFDDQRGIKSVILSSMFFALFHIIFGLTTMGIVFISSLVFGAFYLRHQNLMGVTLLHTTVGMSAFLSGII